MYVWRICSKKQAKDAFNGNGARLYGGRWNKPGTPMVYTAATLSLAALELLVHLDAEEAPNDLVALSADIPEELQIRRLTPADLPAPWRDYPAPESLQNMGTEWVRGGETAVLQVPSAVIPMEYNAVLNPQHPDFTKIRIHPPEPFSFDPRLARH